VVFPIAGGKTGSLTRQETLCEKTALFQLGMENRSSFITDPGAGKKKEAKIAHARPPAGNVFGAKIVRVEKGGSGYRLSVATVNEMKGGHAPPALH